AERALVERAGDALADRQLPGGGLALDAFGAAELARHRLATAQLVELGLPGHARMLCAVRIRTRSGPAAEREEAGCPSFRRRVLRVAARATSVHGAGGYGSLPTS